MVTGVNSNYYNYYNNYQNQYGNYPQQVTSFTANPATQTTSAPASQKTAADGKDDGHISFGSKLKNLGIGALKFVTGMFTDENGSFSLGQTLKTVAIAAGIGAVCVLTAGTAVPAILATAGIGISGIGVAKASVQAALADSDAEAEQAWQSLGSNGAALGLSVAGAKAVAKSSHAAEATAGKFKGIDGLWNSVKTVAQDSYKPVNNAFKGVKDSYQGATFLDKVKNSGTKFKDNVTAQYKDFKGTVTNKFNDTIYGTASKVENEAAALDKQKADIQKQMKSVKDKRSKEYQSLKSKAKEIEVKQDAMREINSTTSWENANSKIEANKSILNSKKAELKTAKSDAQKAKLNSEISELETKINTQGNVLARRTAEVRAIDKRIETITEKMNKEGVSAEQQAKYQAEIDNLNARRTAANFELPSKESVKTAEIKANRAKSNYDQQVKLQNDAIKEYGTNPDNIDKAILESYKQNVANAQKTYKTAKNNYDNMNEAATPGGFKTHVANEVARAAKSELTNGNWKNNLLHQENPSQWLTVGIAGRQFGETPEYRFYSQLSPDEQNQYRQLSHNQKQALTKTYKDYT